MISKQFYGPGFAPLQKQAVGEQYGPSYLPTVGLEYADVKHPERRLLVMVVNLSDRRERNVVGTVSGGQTYACDVKTFNSMWRRP